LASFIADDRPGKISLTQSDTSSLTLPAADGAGEGHYVNRIGWLRAAVLGANDGLLSTGSLMSGSPQPQWHRGNWC
jgi:VIT1/CCC1 family predicted Fe2+/Mn2+ transporter